MSYKTKLRKLFYANFVLILGFSVLLTGSVTVFSQDIKDDSQLANLITSKQESDDNILSIHFTNVSIQDGLEILADKINVGFSYNPDDLVPNKRVNFSMVNVPGHEVIYKLLEGTNLEPVLPPTRDVIILRKKEAEIGFDIMQEVVRGTVVDRQSGELLPGANVFIPEIQMGAATNVDGQFEISGVPTGTYSLQVNYVGYRQYTTDITVKDNEILTLEISLSADHIGMDEVVVTGQAGFTRQREVGNSVSRVNADQIETDHIRNFGDLMSGRVAGATIQQNSGQVGGGSSIRLRGVNSISQGNTPLVYIDGVRVSNRSDNIGIANSTSSPLDEINPADIDRIEIIKGPAATTLYGTEASGGVIQIFTKDGVDGDPRFNFTIQQGFNNNTGGTQGYHSELPLNDCTAFPGCPEDGNWLRNGYIHNYSMSMRGGANNLNYFISANWGDEQGVIAPQGSQSTNFRGNFRITPIEDLTVRWTNSYSFRNTTWIPDGNYFGGFLLNVLRGEWGNTPNNDDSLILEELGETRLDKYTTGVSIDYSPTSSQLHQLKVGMDYLSREYIRERPFGNWISPLGQRWSDQRSEKNLTFEYVGTLDLDLSASISSSVSWGTQFYNDEIINVSGTGQDFTGPGRKVLDSGARTSASENIVRYATGGFFAQNRFGLKDHLFMTLGIRVDGHSTFGEDFGLAPYPKISGAYLISENDFWPEWWDVLKLRAAWGESGQAPGAFDHLRTFSSVAGDDGQPGLSPGNIGNPIIGPERSREIEFGFESSFIQGRVTSNFTWYRQRTYDALVNIPSIPSYGFIQSQLQNVGEIESKGIEYELSVEAVKTQNVLWILGGHISTNQSEAIDLGGITNINIGRNQSIRPGFPVPSAFGQVVVNADEVGAEPIFEERYLGQNYPTEIIGFITSVNLWQSLSINVLGEAHFGHTIFSGLAYQNTRREIWPACRSVQEQIASGNRGSLTAGELGQCDPSITTEGMWYKDADFFKLRSLSIGYNLPDNWLPGGVREINLRLQGRNLFTITDWPGLDPESFEDGDQLYRHEYYNMPTNRTFIFNASFEF